jgi:hypothetical protein
MTTTTEVDLTIKDIADRLTLRDAVARCDRLVAARLRVALRDRCNVTPRTANLWRSSAEARSGRKLGYKVGKTWFFRADEIREILKSREEAIDPRQVSEQNARQSTPNYHAQNSQAEDGILTGMDAIVSSGDKNALAIGFAAARQP